MPGPSSIRTDNPEVAKLLMAHEIATGLAIDTTVAGVQIDIDKYLEAFDRVYKAIRDTTKIPYGAV